jgi:hypothetical protein
VLDREREGMVPSRVGKLLVDILAMEVMVAIEIDVGIANGKDTAQLNGSTYAEESTKSRNRNFMYLPSQG